MGTKKKHGCDECDDRAFVQVRVLDEDAPAKLHAVDDAREEPPDESTIYLCPGCAEASLITLVSTERRVIYEAL